MELATAALAGPLMTAHRKFAPMDALDMVPALIIPACALEPGHPMIAQPLGARITALAMATAVTELASVDVDSLVLTALSLPAPTNARDMVFARTEVVIAHSHGPILTVPSSSVEVDALCPMESVTTEPAYAARNGMVLIANSQSA
jgi:hypothetical protein